MAPNPDSMSLLIVRSINLSLLALKHTLTSYTCPEIKHESCR